MATAALHLDAPTSPVPLVARRLLDFLQAGEKIDARVLRDLLATSTQRSAADGAWSMRHAYDALELAQVMWLGAGHGPDLTDRASALDALIAFGGALPTQTTRTEDQLAFQQFSTPVPIAWLMSIAAELRPCDTILEPSAGTGLLAWPAARLGASLVLNELDAGRRICLEAAFPQAPVSGHDGELIDDLLPAGLEADVLLMNPPFARSIGRPIDRHAAARHLLAALRRLKAGGRAVAVMPTWFDSSVLGPDVSVLLDAVLARGLYSKHGTGLAVRMLVLDKLPASAMRCQPQDAPDLITLLDLVQQLPFRAQPVPPPPPDRKSVV